MFVVMYGKLLQMEFPSDFVFRRQLLLFFLLLFFLIFGRLAFILHQIVKAGWPFGHSVEYPPYEHLITVLKM